MEPQNVTQAPGSSTWSKIGDFFVSIGNMAGKTVCYIGNGIANFAVSVYKWAKPFFVELGKLFANMFKDMKEFISEHQAETIIALLGLAVGAIVTAVAHILCCEGKNTAPASSSNP